MASVRITDKKGYPYVYYIGYQESDHNWEYCGSLDSVCEEFDIPVSMEEVAKINTVKSNVEDFTASDFVDKFEITDAEPDPDEPLTFSKGYLPDASLDMSMHESDGDLTPVFQGDDWTSLAPFEAANYSQASELRGNTLAFVGDFAHIDTHEVNNHLGRYDVQTTDTIGSGVDTVVVGRDLTESEMDALKRSGATVFAELELCNLLENVDGDLSYSPGMLNGEQRAIDAIKSTDDPDELRVYINQYKIDVQHDTESGYGDSPDMSVRRAILADPDVPPQLKHDVCRREVNVEQNIRVPQDVLVDAETALETGKPLVLYGPTGTGKTTFAQQLALRNGVDYIIRTASPSWTSKQILGGVQPDYTSDGDVEYRTTPEAVSEAVLRAREFDSKVTVILDEVTRADISKIFGPLYTAIENNHQPILTLENEDGTETTVRLDDRVNIICTMNMSDRTVNELDDAITRRFAMVKLASYPENDRKALFTDWTSDVESESQVGDGGLSELFEADYSGLNGEDDTDRILEFGPMHYTDVTDFVNAATNGRHQAHRDVPTVVGRAYRTYITPRQLNTASRSQTRALREHYQALDNEFDVVELQPAIDLINEHEDKQKQQIGRQ